MRIIKRINVLLILAAVLFVFAGCTGRGTGEMVKVVTRSDDTSLVERYFNSVENFDSIDYESIVFTTERSVEIGPHESRFRGILYLPEDEASKLWDKYEWEEVDSPDFEFDKLDKSTFGEGPWYRCNQFNSDNFKTVNVHSCYFDGKNIVFDFQQI